MRRSRRTRTTRSLLAMVVLAGVLVALLSVAGATQAPTAAAAPPPVGTVTNHVPYPDNGLEAPRGVAAGPDGAMWVTGGTDRIFRVTNAGAVTLYRDPTISTPAAIIAGPDGALWFVNSGNGSLGRITTAGVVSAFTDPALADVQYLAAGPDGAVWFTRPTPATVGRITSAGVVSVFSDPVLVEPRAITSGPDGALWFGNGADVARLTTAGAFTAYGGMNVGSGDVTKVVGITTGPEGALYFTQVSTLWSSYAKGRVNRLTTAGVVTFGSYTESGAGKLVTMPNGTMFALGFADLLRVTPSLTLDYALGGGWDFAAAADGARWTVHGSGETVSRDGVVVAHGAERRRDSITRGPDGALWYLSPPSSIDRLAPDGTHTRYPSPSSFESTTSFVLGADGGLWFAASDRFNRVAMDGTVTSIYHPWGSFATPHLSAGPDAAVWFAISGDSSRVGKIDTRGVITTFTHPNLRATSLVAGRDGAMWFTNYGSLGRITPDGVISYRTKMDGGAPASDLTVGPDGALWFVRQTNPLSIARVETGPVSSFFGTAITTSITGATVTGAAWGPDGRLWLTLSTGTIIRMTTAGTSETFSLPAPTVATDITPGTDGAMWFTQERLPPTGGASSAVGRIEALGAVSAPSAPTVAASGGDGSFTATWTVGDGGSPLTGVTVTLSPGGATCTWTSGPQTCTVSGLTNGTVYTASVRATNAAGTGPPNVVPAAATPHVRPPQPAFVRAVNVANNCASVSWWPPQGAPVVKAIIRATKSTGSALSYEFAGAASTQTVCTAFFPRTATASFEVTLVTALDSSPWSNSSNPVVIGAPPTPGKPVAKSGDGSAVVSWSNGPVAQTYTQSIITPYRNGVAQAPQTFTSGAAAQTVTGLDNGATYTFTVATSNANGASTTSVRSLPIVVGQPPPPAFPSATAGTASARVQWWPPAVPTTGSIVTPYLNGVAQTPIVFNDAKAVQTITGLTSGQSYTFTIALTNTYGTGPTSTTAAVVIS